MGKCLTITSPLPHKNLTGGYKNCNHKKSIHNTNLYPDWDGVEPSQIYTILYY